MLEKHTSQCEKYQKIIVPRDQHSSCEHRAFNKNNSLVRQYKIDGDVVPSPAILKCDFLLLNDDKKKAYLIELKGTDIKHAIDQLKNTEQLLKKDLMEYEKFYRIVYKSNTHGIRSNAYIRFAKEKCGRVYAKTEKMEENI